MVHAKVPSSSLDKITAEFLEQKLAELYPPTSASGSTDATSRAAAAPRGRARAARGHRDRTAQGGGSRPASRSELSSTAAPRPFPPCRRNRCPRWRSPRQPPPRLRLRRRCPSRQSSRWKFSETGRAASAASAAAGAQDRGEGGFRAIAASSRPFARPGNEAPPAARRLRQNGFDPARRRPQSARRSVRGRRGGAAGTKAGRQAGFQIARARGRRRARRRRNSFHPPPAS